MLMILIERVIQVTVKPPELWDYTKIERHLRVIIRFVVISGSDRVDFLIDVRVDDIIAPVVMWLLPIILLEVRRVEIENWHICYYNYYTTYSN